MSKRFRFSSMGLAWVLALVWCQASPIKVRPDRANGVYALNEPISWTISWQSPGEIPPPFLRYQFQAGGLTVVREGYLDFSRHMARLESVIEEPNAVLLEVFWEKDGEEQSAWGGAVAAHEEIEPAAPAPEDFNAFWKAKIAQLKAVPMNPVVESGDTGVEGVEYFKIRMDNIRGSHIHGQLALPAGGQSLPALLRVQWAGVYGLQKSWVTDHAANGWLTLNILAHDLPIDKPDNFYREQWEGPLKDYWEIGNDDPDKSYFLRMYLSCYRAVEYLKTRPEWDGKTLVVEGTSQGGQQTLVTAGLHPDITAAMALVPSGNDMLAPAIGRASAFPNWYSKTEGRDAERVRETSRYFDAINFAARIDCPLLIGVGLRDRVCPPAGIFAAVNQVDSFKEVIILPESAHQNEEGSQDAYTERLYQDWLPALREGKAIPEKKSIY